MRAKGKLLEPIALFVVSLAYAVLGVLIDYLSDSYKYKYLSSYITRAVVNLLPHPVAIAALVLCITAFSVALPGFSKRK